jgi:hypothetical protein
MFCSDKKVFRPTVLRLRTHLQGCLVVLNLEVRLVVEVSYNMILLLQLSNYVCDIKFKQKRQNSRLKI